MRIRAILIDQQSRVILLKRIKPNREPYWVAPGGGLESTDTSPEDALRRELWEELGATADIQRPVLWIENQIFYLCRLIEMNLEQRNGPEYDDPARGAYVPQAIAPDQLADLNILPPELKVFLIDTLRAE